MKLKEILFKNELTKDDLVYLFEIKEQNELEHLFQRADEVRREHCGDDVHLRGIKLTVFIVDLERIIFLLNDTE